MRNPCNACVENGSGAMSKPIRVLIIDDSALVRKLLTRILETDAGIEVAGTATDPYAAREKIKKLKPDVLTLDVAMPKMDGITFLRNLMRLHPMPVVMLSCLTEKGADIALQALELGAIDFISKPKTDLNHNLEQYSEEIITKLKTAAKSRVQAYTDRPVRLVQQDPGLATKAVHKHNSTNEDTVTTNSIIVIGASTGGTEAIKSLLATLPITAPGTVITQHIPAAFSARFAENANNISAMNVCEAQDDQLILQGHVYIAPGDRHLTVVRKNRDYYCKLSDGPSVNRHKPSVDVLFRSASESAGPNAVGVLLTGMGDDGARGLKEMQQAGAMTIAQDEHSSVVWGMPGAAVKLGAADKILPLDRIPNALVTHQLPQSDLQGSSKQH